MEQLIDVVTEYVRQKHAGGTTWYGWSFDPEKVPSGVLDGGVQGSDWYARNADLKLRLRDSWLAGNAAFRAQLERYYIVDWGGVRGNLPETLEAYHAASAGENIARGKTGIASWSKALCVRDPLRYAIFDARVAASLNALQIIHRSRIGEPVCFPVLASQNGTVKRANAQLRSHFREHAWPRVRPGFYTDYLEVCRFAASRIGTPGQPLPIHAVEMALFAHTEELLREAFPEAAPV
jgi:hypothetical protein